MESGQRKSKLLNSCKLTKTHDAVASQSYAIRNDSSPSFELTARSLTLFSPSMTMTGTGVAGQRCLAGRGLSQFHRTMT